MELQNVISQEQVSKSAKRIDAEEAVIRLYKKIINDKKLNAYKILFSDVTANELATVLHAAWGHIDILKFELGED